MRDVADAAGVSLKTVSRVVNRSQGVRPSTAARVERAIQQLGFRRNDLARSLRHGHASATVGLVIGDVGNPFYSAIARAVETVARARGSTLITGSSDEDQQEERELVGMLLTRRVDGLLLVPAAGDHRWLADDIRLGARVVFLDRPPQGLALDAVVFDNARGGSMAVHHLLRQGFRRIAIVADAPTIHTMSERYRGYCHALEDAGVGVDPELVSLGNHDADAAQRAATALLSLPDPPDAVFAGNNLMTVGVLRAFDALGTSAGLVGFDDFELANLLGVTVVSASPATMGTRGAELLFSRLDGDERPARQIVLAPVLVARRSSQPRKEKVSP